MVPREIPAGASITAWRQPWIPAGLLLGRTFQPGLEFCRVPFSFRAQTPQTSRGFAAPRDPQSRERSQGHPTSPGHWGCPVPSGFVSLWPLSHTLPPGEEVGMELLPNSGIQGMFGLCVGISGELSLRILLLCERGAGKSLWEC